MICHNINNSDPVHRNVEIINVLENKRFKLNNIGLCRLEINDL